VCVREKKINKGDQNRRENTDHEYKAEKETKTILPYFLCDDERKKRREEQRCAVCKTERGRRHCMSALLVPLLAGCNRR